MNRISTRSVASLAVALVALALVAFLAATFGRAAAPDPTPSAPPVATPTPIVTPTPGVTPSPVVTPSPQPSGPTGGLFEFDLDVSTPHHISVVVHDQVGNVTGAASGRAGDGMSVRWGEAEVVNVDEDTIRVTWVGLPGDAEIKIWVGGTADKVDLFIAQPQPPENSDALGHDQVIVLDFSGPVNAADVETLVQESFDTAG